MTASVPYENSHARGSFPKVDDSEMFNPCPGDFNDPKRHSDDHYLGRLGMACCRRCGYPVDIADVQKLRRRGG